jgi:hypothetical protein
VLCGVLALLVGGAGACAVWRSVRSSAEFAVRAVRVAGVSDPIAAEIRALAGVPLGTNIWDVDLQEVRVRVLRQPWVATAEVRRELPGEIVVMAEERRALAALDVGGVPYGVDRRGQLFASLDAERARRLPRITGLGDLRPLQAGRRGTRDAPSAREGARARDVEEGQAGQTKRFEGQEARTVRMLRRATALVRVAGRRCRLTEVRIDPLDGLTALIEELGDVPVEFGWRRLRAKERRLDTVVGLWAGREGTLEKVSLAFRDQVVVTLRRGVAIESAAGREPSGT